MPDLANGQPRHLTPALTVSIVVHATAFLSLLLLIQASKRSHVAEPITPPRPVQMVWIPDPRPAARGGGAPPKQSQPAPIPQAAVAAPQPAPVPVEPQTIAPEPERVIDTAPSPPVAATGDSNAQRASAGNIDGAGPGGAGSDKGPGNGGTVYGVGNGVSAPIPLRRPPPAYTADAMRARLQGVVVINCIVQPDGTCSDIMVAKSLDRTLGLDQQAIASAREWRFRPGLRLGEPVPVMVTLEIAFSIR